MNDMRRPGRARVAAGACPAIVLVVLTAGCQSYEGSPLDIPGHRGALAARLGEPEPLAAFASRLGEQGQEAPTAFDPGDGLTRAEGELVALFYNAELRMARLDAGVALATLVTAGLWEDPEVGFDGAQILSPESMFQYGLVLGLTIPVSGRLEVERARAGAEHEAALRRIVDDEWSTRARLRSAWAAWSVAGERARLLELVIVQVERIGAITGRLESVGELTRVEGRLLRIELAQRRGELVAARLAATRSRLELLGLMGLPPDAAIELVPAISMAVVGEHADPTARLIESSTTLAVRRAEYQAAEEGLRLEVRKQYPDLTIGGGYGDEDDDRLLLGASIPIPILNANGAGIAEARARRDAARGAAETTFERLARELAMATAALEGSLAQRDAFESEIVPMLEEQSQELERLAEVGEVDTLLLLETVSRGFEARSRLLDLRLAEVVASVDLARLLGPGEPRSPAPVDVSVSGARRVESGSRHGADAAPGGDR